MILFLYNFYLSRPEVSIEEVISRPFYFSSTSVQPWFNEEFCLRLAILLKAVLMFLLTHL